MHTNANGIIRLAVVDDHAMFRDALCPLLSQQNDFHLIGEASDARAGILLVDREHPDVLLFDMKLPGMDGITAARELRVRAPTTRVLMLSGYSPPHGVREAFDAGVIGYLSKTESADRLIQSIRIAASGSRVASAYSNTVPILTEEDASGGPLAPLSRRERDVFRLLVSGLNSRQIAKELRISHKTVESRREHILKKLELHSLVELVRYAAAHQLLG